MFGFAYFGLALLHPPRGSLRYIPGAKSGLTTWAQASGASAASGRYLAKQYAAQRKNPPPSWPSKTRHRQRTPAKSGFAYFGQAYLPAPRVFRSPTTSVGMYHVTFIVRGSLPLILGAKSGLTTWACPDIYRQWRKQVVDPDKRSFVMGGASAASGRYLGKHFVPNLHFE